MIELDRDSRRWVVKINRPEKANSLTAAMLEELCQIAEDADGKTSAFVLTGAGPVFSAGADLEEARAGLAKSGLWERLSGAIASLPCLTIAALNGTVAGGAFGMVLACDLRISVPTAKFFYPVMKLGFLPQPSDPGRLVELIGPARAKMILLAGQKIGATEALSWGLIERLADPSELFTVSDQLCEDVLSAAPSHSDAIKNMLR